MRQNVPGELLIGALIVKIDCLEWSGLLDVRHHIKQRFRGLLDLQIV